MKPEPNRRTFLTGAGAAALAGLAAACAADEDGVDAPPTAAPEVDTASVVDTPDPVPEPTVDAAPVLFRSDRQLAVLEAPQAAGIVASFDVLVSNREQLSSTLQDLGAEIERIMDGAPPVAGEGFLPPVDSGLVDATGTTTGTTVSLGVGASLFDGRFDLADRRPPELIPMPTFFNDRLVRPELSHGDLVLVIAGPSRQAAAYALQQIVRVTDRRLRIRWVQEGFNELLPPATDRLAPTRNLMGFRDGTSNLDTTDPAAMDEHVWIGARDGPDWAVGGTYLAVRLIRILVEFWSTAALVRQEQIFGRHRDTGAPLGQLAEGDEPAFVADPDNVDVPRRSHIRLANPRTPGAARILRRGFSYLNGADSTTGTLDQGLLFLAYQRSLRNGFLEVQSRLEGEPLEDYVKPVGGGLFLVLPGPGADGWLGDSLLG